MTELREQIARLRAKFEWSGPETEQNDWIERRWRDHLDFADAVLALPAASPPQGVTREQIAQTLFASEHVFERASPWAELFDSEKTQFYRQADAILALPANSPPAGWREIESAPKDGTSFIYQDTDGSVSTCLWRADDCGFDWYDIHGDQIAYPLRWMPLPEPPPPQEGREA